MLVHLASLVYLALLRRSSFAEATEDMGFGG